MCFSWSLFKFYGVVFLKVVFYVFCCGFSWSCFLRFLLCVFLKCFLQFVLCFFLVFFTFSVVLFLRSFLPFLLWFLKSFLRFCCGFSWSLFFLLFLLFLFLESFFTFSVVLFLKFVAFSLWLNHRFHFHSFLLPSINFYKLVILKKGK